MAGEAKTVGDNGRATFLKRTRRCSLFLVVLGLVTAWVLLEKSPKIVSLPVVRPQLSDAIVVLGGEPNNRPKLAAQLFHDGISSRIIVTGRGDSAEIAVKMLARGVPLENIVRETVAWSTYENARRTVPLLDKIHARRVVIVTSWFHARRARACFQHFRPGMEFVVVTTSRESEWRYSADSWAWLELLKTGVYWVRYGIPPFQD